MKLINILLIVAIPLGLFSFYLFYFADCSTVRDYWYLTQTPARCTDVAEEVEPSFAEVQEARDMCLQGIYPAGRSFNIQETNAGEYSYEIYATTAGTEVWIPCGKIE